MPSPNKYARPQNAHLRSVNSAFSGIAGLKLHLFIQPPNRMGMTNLLLVIPIMLYVSPCGLLLSQPLADILGDALDKAVDSLNGRPGVVWRCQEAVLILDIV